MKNQSTTLISPLQHEPLSRKLAEVFKRIIAMFGYHGKDSTPYTSAANRMIATMQGAKDFPAPLQALKDSIEEMNTAVEVLRKKKYLSEKKKRRAYKVLRRQITKLIEGDNRILLAGFDVKTINKR